MALVTLVSEDVLAPGVSMLICRQSICLGDQLDLELPGGGRQSGRIVARLPEGLTIEVGGRRLDLRRWKKSDPLLPDYRGEGSRWTVAA